MELFTVTRATKAEVIDFLSRSMNISQKESDKVFSFFEKNKEALPKGESFEECKRTLDDLIGQATQNSAENSNFTFMTFDAKYSINVRFATIVLAAWFLDIRLTHGMASTLLGLFGCSGKALVILTAEERCIGLEALRKHGCIKVSTFFPLSEHECVHHNCITKCKYRETDTGHCRITIENFNDLLKKLVENRVFVEENGIYKIPLF